MRNGSKREDGSIKLLWINGKSSALFVRQPGLLNRCDFNKATDEIWIIKSKVSNWDEGTKRSDFKTSDQVKYPK